MKKILLTLTLFILIFSKSTKIFAQRDFRSGYIITITNDTIPGTILFNDLRIYFSCTFKNEFNQIETFQPFEINGFGFNEGKFFISKKVPTNKGEKNYFVEFLIKGKANIYFYRDDNQHYLFENNESKIIELTQEDIILERQDGSFYIRPNNYKNKLKLLLNDCPDIYNEIDNLVLDHKNLISFAKDYHNYTCDSEKCIIFEREPTPPFVKFGPLAGLAINSLRFGSTLSTNYSYSQFIGIRIQIKNLFHWVEHTSILSDITINRLTSYTFTSNGLCDVIQYGNDSYRLNHPSIDKISSTPQLNIDPILLKLPIIIEHSTSSKRIGLIYGIGLTNNIVLKYNEIFEIQTYEYYLNKSIPTYQAGIILEGGLNYTFPKKHNIFLKVNLELSESMNVNQALRMQNKTISFCTGYMF